MRGHKDRQRGRYDFAAAYWSQELTQAVAPVVRQARKEIFGTEAAPLASYTDADEWLREKQRRATPPPELKRLRTWTRRLSNATGWPEASSTRCLLADVIPVASTSIRIEAGKACGFVVSVRLWPWDLSRRRLEELGPRIHRMIFEAEQAGWTKLGAHLPISGPPGKNIARVLLDLSVRATEPDLKLLALIQQIGAAPPEGRGRGRRIGQHTYWKQVAGRWREEYGGQANPDALRWRYRRLLKKLSRR